MVKINAILKGAGADKSTGSKLVVTFFEVN